MTPSTLPLKQRLARIAPYFANTRWGFVLAIAGAVVAAATEPLIPAMLQHSPTRIPARHLPLWMIPTAIIGILQTGAAGSWPSRPRMGRQPRHAADANAFKQ